LEKTKKVAICPMPILWSDVGSWDSLYEALDKDQNQNVKFGNVLEMDTKNSLIIGGKKLISTIGLEDVLIVDTDDAIFITKKGESQKVKALVQELVRIGRREGLNSAANQYSWGNVKQLYNGEGCKVELVQIHPQQSYNHQVQKNVVENWINLSGEVEMISEDVTKRILSAQSFQSSEGVSLILKNTTNEFVEVLLTSHELSC
jgi:mannose-1-phosphate guanylyltransferase/mannose-6-phosphate isomerase